MKKYIFTAIAALCIVASCAMPDYEYKGSPNAQKPNITVNNYTVKPYTGTIEALKGTAMTVSATASGSIAVTFPAPVGDKTGTTVMVVVAEDTGAVTLVATNN